MDLSPVIAATTQWLLRAYPSIGGALGRALAEAQAYQAVTVAASLRYPTPTDAALVSLTGPGGSTRLDWLVGFETHMLTDDAYGWRTWVDEVVASWAACLLTDPGLAAAAVSALSDEHSAGQPDGFRRLTDPGQHDFDAARLLRHPDLLMPIADLHRADLLELLDTDSATAA